MAASTIPTPLPAPIPYGLDVAATSQGLFRSLTSTLNVLPKSDLIDLQRAEEELRRSLGGSTDALNAQLIALERLRAGSRMSRMEANDFFATVYAGSSSITMTSEQISRMGRVLDSSLPGAAANAARSLQQLWGRFPEHQMAMQRGVVSLTALAEAYRMNGQAGFDAAAAQIGYATSLETLQQKLRGISNSSKDANASLSKALGVESLYTGLEKLQKSFGGITAELKAMGIVGAEVGLILTGIKTYQRFTGGGPPTPQSHPSGGIMMTRGQSALVPLYVQIVGGGMGGLGVGFNNQPMSYGGSLTPNPMRTPGGMITPGQTVASAGWWRTQGSALASNPIVQMVAATVVIEGATIAGNWLDRLITGDRRNPVKANQEDASDVIFEILKKTDRDLNGYLHTAKEMGVSSQAFRALSTPDSLSSLNEQLTETGKYLEDKRRTESEKQLDINNEFAANRKLVDNIEDRIRSGEDVVKLEVQHSMALAALNETFNKQKGIQLEVIKAEQEHIGVYDRQIALLKLDTGMASVRRDIIQQLMPGNLGANIQSTMEVANAKMAEAEKAKAKSQDIRLSEPLRKAAALEAAQSASDALREVLAFRRGLIEQMGSQAMNLPSGTYGGAPVGGLKPGDSIRGMPSVASWAGSGYSDFTPLAKDKNGKFIGRPEHGNFEQEFMGRFGVIAGQAQGYLPVLTEMAMKGDTTNALLATVAVNTGIMAGSGAQPNSTRSTSHTESGSSAPAIPAADTSYLNTTPAGPILSNAAMGYSIGLGAAMLGGVRIGSALGGPGAIVGGLIGAQVGAGYVLAGENDAAEKRKGAEQSNFDRWLMNQSGGDAQKEARLKKWISHQFGTDDPSAIGRMLIKEDGGFKSWEEIKKTDPMPFNTGYNAPLLNPVGFFAGGGDFYTNGPMTMVVGDNPGGVERVSVTPVSGRGVTRGIPGGMAFGGGTGDPPAPTDKRPDESWGQYYQRTNPTDYQKWLAGNPSSPTNKPAGDTWRQYYQNNHPTDAQDWRSNESGWDYHERTHGRSPEELARLAGLQALKDKDRAGYEERMQKMGAFLPQGDETATYGSDKFDPEKRKKLNWDTFEWKHGWRENPDAPAAEDRLNAGWGQKAYEERIAQTQNFNFRLPGERRPSDFVGAPDAGDFGQGEAVPMINLPLTSDEREDFIAQFPGQAEKQSPYGIVAMDPSNQFASAAPSETYQQRQLRYATINRRLQVQRENTQISGHDWREGTGYQSAGGFGDHRNPFIGGLTGDPRHALDGHLTNSSISALTNNRTAGQDTMNGGSFAFNQHDNPLAGRATVGGQSNRGMGGGGGVGKVAIETKALESKLDKVCALLTEMKDRTWNIA